MLYNKKSNGHLATDVFDRISTTDEAYHVTTAKNTFACARTVFIIKKYEKDLYNDNIVRYGQKIQFQINPLLIKKELFLHSTQTSPTHVARFSRKQEVGFYAKTGYNTVWEIEHFDPKIRFETSGEPVKAGDPILIKHAQTAQWLASDDAFGLKNDFGVEFEVFSHSYQTLNKTQNLIAEKTGRTTIDIPSRNQLDQNAWAIVGATDSSQEFDESILFKPLDASDYLGILRKKLLDKGPYAVRNLLAQFKKIDLNQSGTLDQDDFKWGLRNFGIILNTEELSSIFNYFDRNGNGVIDFGEFLSVLKGNIGKTRGQLIEKAYGHLEEKFNKEVTFENLVKAFQAKNHPDVARNLKNEKEVFREFVDAWQINQADRIISFDDFFAYYSDLSGCIANDVDFEKIIKSVWGFK